MNTLMNRRATGLIKSALAASALTFLGGAAQADTYQLYLFGDALSFGPEWCGGALCQGFSLPLSGLDSTNPITVVQGDILDVTVTLDQAKTIPTSPYYTNLLLFLNGSTFPAENTGVNGTFTFYLNDAVVNVFSYGSTTSQALASYAAVFPPYNGSFTFDSFTDDFTINTLGTPATLDSSRFEYDLVSSAVPEPSTWAMMLLGFAGLGIAGCHWRRKDAIAA